MPEANDASRPWASVRIEKGKVVGKDGKEWSTVNIPQGSTGIFRMKVGNKRLEIVGQEKYLKVHVNPDPDGLDFWENPADSGTCAWLGWPLDRTSIKRKTQSPATEGEPALQVLKKDPESGYNSGSYWVPESGYGSESSWTYISTEAATAATATTAAATDQSKENEETMVTATGMN